MYKYLAKHSHINIKKHLDNKLNHANHCDLGNLLKFMSVRNGSEGIRKLYKLMSNLPSVRSHFSNNFGMQL